MSRFISCQFFRKVTQPIMVLMPMKCHFVENLQFWIISYNLNSWLERELLLTSTLLNKVFQVIKDKIVSPYILCTPSRFYWPLWIITTIKSPSPRTLTYQIRCITRFISTWATRQVPHVKQDLLTFPEHLRSILFFIGFALLSVCYCVLWCVYCHFLK